MNGYDYKLKEKQVNNISDIASCIDDLRSDLNHNSENSAKRIDNGLGDVCTFIEALTSQVVILNKTMGRIANAIETNNCEQELGK
tara:strand:+ start:245 stop:499 length:255 start_codon:yes stop_codon:yes gene_type:complete